MGFYLIWTRILCQYIFIVNISILNRFKSTFQKSFGLFERLMVSLFFNRYHIRKILIGLTFVFILIIHLNLSQFILGCRSNLWCHVFWIDLFNRIKVSCFVTLRLFCSTCQPYLSMWMCVFVCVRVITNACSNLLHHFSIHWIVVIYRLSLL